MPGRPGLVSYPLPQRARNGVESASPRSYANADQSCTPIDYRHNGNERPTPGFEFATVALETRMPRTGSLPTIVPRGADQTVYLVVDSFGANGAVYRETEVERTDLESIIGDLISGQFNDPVHPLPSIGLNFGPRTFQPILLPKFTRCDIDGEPVPEHVNDFVKSHARSTRPLTLRLV